MAAIQISKRNSSGLAGSVRRDGPTPAMRAGHAAPHPRQPQRAAARAGSSDMLGGGGAQVDLLLVTHFHNDHAAAVPFFMRKTAFKLPPPRPPPREALPRPPARRSQPRRAPTHARAAQPNPPLVVVVGRGGRE